MTKEKVAGLVSTEIGLNTTKATESLDKLKASVKDNANEWKQMESQMKQSGDSVGASKVKYEGLTESVEKQEVVLERLRKEQAEVNRSTQAGEQVYQKYASDITKAERQLTSLVGQQHKAKQSYELQADGITELNQKIKQNDELTKLQTDRLDAEGNKTKAVTRAKEGLATKIRLMNELYEKQSSRLSRLESSENGETEAIRKQRLALEKTATAISQAKHNMEGLGHESQKAGSTFSETFKGTALAQGAMQAWYSVKGSIENAVEAGAEFNKEQDTMKTVWHALTTEAPKDGKELVSFINDISNHSIYTADSVNDMAQAFYHVHSNVKETKNWTQDFINLGSTMHLTDAQLSESGETFAKIVAGGKVGAEDLNMMINRFPMFGEAVQKASGKSMAELRQMSASGKLTSDVFVKAMDELGSKYKDGQAEAMTSFQGMTMYLGKRRAQLFGEIEQSSFNISKKMKANILDITSDKSMEAYAKAISKAMASVMGIVAKMIDYIRKHQKDIMQLISSVAKIVSIFGGAIWNTIKITFGAIGKSIGLIGGNANKAHDPLKTINTALTNILAHKHAIQALGAVLVSAFAVKKMSDFGRGVKSTLGVISDLRRGVIALATSEKLASTAQWAMTGAQKALNLAMKANPIGLVIVAITALVAGLVELYKHNKKFRQFVDGLVKSAKQFFEGIVKWFGNAWSSVTKGYNSFSRSFSKGWNSFTDGIGKAWNATWSYVGNIFSKYTDIYKRVIKTFIDFFTGNWNNLGKDIRGIWNALWGYVESIFGSKVGAIKSGIEGFGSKIWGTFQTIKDKVSGFWSDMWTGLQNFARDGINNVIGVINTGIGGINTVIHTFGGKKEAISKIPKFANGTKGAPKGLAVVNDAPGEHYQEAIIDNSGRTTVLEGRNRLVNFSGGEVVVPAHAMPHFANGTDNWLDTAIGWISDKWDKLTEFIAHPIKALGNVMNKAVSGIAGSPLVTNIAPAMANGLVQGISDPIVNMFKSLKKKHEDEDVVAQAGEGAMSKESFNKTARKAADMIGEHLSGADLAQLWSQAMFESNVNPSINTGYDDHDGTGLPRGLFQYKISTFDAWKYPGHNNILSALDQFLAVFNMMDWRSALAPTGVKRGWGPWGAKRFANGGWINSRTFAEMGEEGFPEVVIPMNPSRKPRANQLLAEANQRINGLQGQQVVVHSDTAQLEQKFDNVITLLSLMLGVNQDQLKVMQSQGGINLPNLMNQMGMAQTTHNYQSV